MQDLICKLPGVVSTRVGYTGGDGSCWCPLWRILALRRAALTVPLHQAPFEDLAAPERVAEAIAAALPEDAPFAFTTCRFCDERRCIDCPMEVFGSLEPAGGPVIDP